MQSAWVLTQSLVTMIGGVAATSIRGDEPSDSLGGSCQEPTGYLLQFLVSG